MKEKTEYEKFSDATKKIMGVSREEYLRREAEWRKEHQKERGSKKKRVSRASSGHASRES